MAIVLAAFIVWCLATKSGTEEETIVVSTYDTTYEKQPTAESLEEEYGIACFEGTSGAQFFTDLWATVGYEDMTVSSARSSHMTYDTEYVVYMLETDTYLICVEAHKDTDEIHYIKIVILDWEAAGESAGIFLAAAGLIGEDVLFSGSDYDAGDFEADAEDFCSQLIDDWNNGYSSVILCENCSIEFFDYFYCMPALEIMAVNTENQ